MTYEIGQKVETPLGVGNVLYVPDDDTYKISIQSCAFNIHWLYFYEEELKPYKTAHDKLVEMGLHLKITNDYAGGIFSHEWWNDNDAIVLVFFVVEKVTTVYEANHDIMRIIPQYLEEMVE